MVNNPYHSILPSVWIFQLPSLLITILSLTLLPLLYFTLTYHVLSGYYCQNAAGPAPDGPCWGGYICAKGETKPNPTEVEAGYFAPNGSSSPRPCEVKKDGHFPLLFKGHRPGWLSLLARRDFVRPGYCYA